MAKKQQEDQDGAASAGSFSPEKAAAAYFKANKDYPHNSILVSEDGNFFHSDLKGTNAADNHGSPYTEVHKD